MVSREPVQYPEGYEDAHTAVELERALEATRMESGGITLDLVARLIVKAFDAAEVRALLDGIERHRTDV